MQETDLTELEPLEISSGTAQGGPAEEATHDTAIVGESSTGSAEPVGAGEPVPRAEFEQLDQQHTERSGQLAVAAHI